ncbi:hypothetical protein V6K52_16460 [Knoellia sp. S7-12]|uniref:hypothetical protein n=1 Tax=Knoellia sp. S7-12 TaxID=3126698 RepID=UPI00336635DD
MNPGERDTAEQARALNQIAGRLASSLGLLAAIALVWYVSGIPPAFLSGNVRWAIGLWLLVGLLGLVTFFVTRASARQADIERGRRRWPLLQPTWLWSIATVGWIAVLVGLTFVIDTRVPALILGDSPMQASAESVSFVDADSRGDVDRSKVRFEVDGHTVDAWLVDPHNSLRETPVVVYDPADPQRVMALDAWRSARSTLELLPAAVGLWLALMIAPFGVARLRSWRLGSLRPGKPIARVTRPRRGKLLTVEWSDGRSTTYFEVLGLGDAIQARINADGEPGVTLPPGTTVKADHDQ